MTSTYPKNRVILGLMNFGPPHENSRVTDHEEFKKFLDDFQSKGYNEVDTARVYVGGQQENWTAKADWKGRGLKLATKWYPWNKGDHRAEILSAKIDESLKQLETDSVDIYYLHAADRGTPFQETLKAINDAYLQGKFKTFAISNFTAAEVAEVCLTCKYNNWVKPTLYQGAYNVINRGPEDDLIPTLHRFGLDFVVYNPIAGGLLTGKIKHKDDIPAEGRFSEAFGLFGAMYRARYFRNGVFEGLKLIDDAAKKHNLTMVEVALRWLVHHSQLRLTAQGGHDGIIIGASSLKQLDQNLADLEKGPLPDDVLEACEAAWAGIAGSRPPYYHGQYKYDYNTTEALYGPGKL